MRTFEDMFKAIDDPDRTNFLARLFGLFSEKAIKRWCECKESRFKDLGRPTLKKPGERRGCTLDFTLQEKNSRYPKIFVAEMKCWLAIKKGQYLRLQNMDFIKSFMNESAAFRTLLEFAEAPSRFDVRVSNRGRTDRVDSRLERKQSVHADGAILIWSAVAERGREEARKAGFADVLSIEEILRELRYWNCEAWKQDVAQLDGWSADLFQYLV